MGETRGNYRRWIAWILIVIVGYIAASYLVMGLLSVLVTTFPATIQLGSVGLLWARVWIGVLTFVIAFLTAMVLRIGPISFASLGIGRLPEWKDIGLSLAGVVVYAAMTILLLTLARLLPFFDASQPQDLGATMLFGLDRLLAFAALVVCIPIIEEVIFRGLLYGKLREARMPFWPAALVVSVLFGVAHGQLNVAIDVFCMSMVACYLRHITGSIWAGVLLHIVKNAIAFIFVYVMMRGVTG